MLSLFCSLSAQSQQFHPRRSPERWLLVCITTSSQVPPIPAGDSHCHRELQPVFPSITQHVIIWQLSNLASLLQPAFAITITSFWSAFHKLMKAYQGFVGVGHCHFNFLCFLEQFPESGPPGLFSSQVLQHGSKSRKHPPSVSVYWE